MKQQDSFGTLCSRLGVKFLCPYCQSESIVKSGKNCNGKQRYQCKYCHKRFITDYTYKAYREKYGKTAEFSIWSHAGLDGPTGTARTSSYPLDSKQMSIEGWSKINFNWDSNASAYFFGCRTGVGDGDTPSFTTKISGKHNFNGVDVYGQTSYAYPSQYVNYRENSDWGDDSFWKKKGDKIIFSPTYMVGGVAKHDIFNFDSSTTVYPMRLSKNGKVLDNQFQPGKKHK